MRLELSKKNDLALRAMHHLDQLGPADGRTLAQAIGTSTHFLPQIMKPLTRAGWVGSTPGPGGGYRLLARLADVSVLDVIHAIEGPTDVGRCVLSNAPCPVDEQCAMHDSWVRARAALMSELEATTLEAALSSGRSKGDEAWS